MDKKKVSTFSYKLVQISPIMILVNSGAFLSISSWFCELTELIFVMIPYISSTGYPPKAQGTMGHVQVANDRFLETRGLRSEHIKARDTSFNYGAITVNSLKDRVQFEPCWPLLGEF